MDNELQKIIDEKIASDKRRRRTSIVFAILFLICICSVFYLTSKLSHEKEISEKLRANLRDLVNQNNMTKDSVVHINKNIPVHINEIAKVIAEDQNKQFANGKAKWKYTFIVTDSILLNTVDSVEYIFDSKEYPMRAIRRSAKDNFKLSYDGWGCYTNVILIFHKKDLSVDSINFPMCDKIIYK